MKNKKTICIIVPTHWSKRMGGSQYQVKCLIEKLSTLDHFDIYFLTRNCDSSFQPTGHKLIQISSLPGVVKFGFFIDTFSLLRLLKQIKPDIIYQRVGCAYTGIAAFYAKKNSCKMVWHIAHDLDVQPFRNRISLLYFFRYVNQKYLEYGINNCAQIVAQTKQQGVYLKQYFNKDAFAVIRNFHPLPKETIIKYNPIKILWVANFKAWKQPEQFIRLSEDLLKIHENIQCIMVGEPSSSESAWQKSLEDRIGKVTCLEYLGGQKIEEVNRLLSGAHIFVNTSLYEGFPNTFIQAWMRKVPVISLACNPDGVFDDRKIGFYSAGSYEEMLRQVDLLIKNSTLREEMGENAQQYAFNVHSDKNIDSLITILDS